MNNVVYAYVGADNDFRVGEPQLQHGPVKIVAALEVKNDKYIVKDCVSVLKMYFDTSKAYSNVAIISMLLKIRNEMRRAKESAPQDMIMYKKMMSQLEIQ